MLKIKNKRNSLAHGNETFAQVVRNFTVQEFVVMKNEIKIFLDPLLQKKPGISFKQRLQVAFT